MRARNPDSRLSLANSTIGLAPGALEHLCAAIAKQIVVSAGLLSMAIKRPDRAALRRYSRPHPCDSPALALPPEAVPTS